MVKSYPEQHCVLSLILKLLVIQKRQRETSLPRLSKNLGTTLYNIGIKSDLGDFFDDSDTPNFIPYVDNEGIEEPTMPEADAIADYDRYI